MTQHNVSMPCESDDLTDLNARLAARAFASKRRLLCGLAASAVSVMARRQMSIAATSRQIRAIAFDAFAIFDIRAVAARAKSLFPENAEALTNVWTAKLFSYSWLLTSASRYLDFESIAMASLKFAADSLALILDDRSRDELVSAYSQLSIWPDVEPALRRLRAMGIRLC
jgi:2-haloacid dehalogenase